MRLHSSVQKVVSVISQGLWVTSFSCPAVAFHFSKAAGSVELMESIHHLLFKSKGKVDFPYTRSKSCIKSLFNLGQGPHKQRLGEEQAVILTMEQTAQESLSALPHTAIADMGMNLPVPVQLSTRKRDIMAFSGLVYSDEKVWHARQSFAPVYSGYTVFGQQACFHTLQMWKPPWLCTPDRRKCTC